MGSVRESVRWINVVRLESVVSFTGDVCGCRDWVFVYNRADLQRRGAHAAHRSNLDCEFITARLWIYSTLLSIIFSRDGEREGKTSDACMEVFLV